MFEEVTYISCILNERTPTHYFYHKQTKTLIPVKVEEAKSLKLFEEGNPGQPSSVETLKKVIYATGAEVKSIKVYLFQDSVYYTYVSIKSSEKEFDINTNFSEAISLAGLVKSPILFEKNIIKECGFRVTKKMIEKALLS
jgi:bifunctional DNase/RNase